MNLVPMGDRMIVEQSDPETVSKGGLVIPQIAQDAPQRGRVLAVGEKVEAAVVGDVVLFSRFGGTELAFDLLDRMLPTEVIQVPVVSEWREICDVA